MIRGRIGSAGPVIRGSVLRDGDLRLGNKGVRDFVVDTGFTGACCIPEAWVGKLRLRFAAYEEYELAVGHTALLPVYVGWIRIGRRRTEARMIPGDCLIGLGLLQINFNRMHLDFRRKTIVMDP